jgi:tetratricopeptide (TPR) repeat protein
MLIPLEDHMNELYFSLTVDGEPREPIFTENLFRAAVADPEVPGQLLLSMKAYMKGREMTDELMDALGFMHEEQIKGRVFSLWMKRRKGADVRKTFEGFVSDISAKMRSSLLTSPDPRKELMYILSLQPEEIRMLEFRIISDKAREWSNLGIRSFHEGDLESAEDLIERSISVMPANPMAHWNMSRLLYRLDRRPEAVKRFDKVIKLLTDKDLSKEAKKEQDHMRKGSIDPDSLGPRSELPI